MLRLLPPRNLILHDVSIILKEINVFDTPISHSEIYWLECLRILYSLNHCYFLWFSPIPQSDISIHIICGNVFGVKWRFGNSIVQSANPLGSPYPTGLTWKYKFFPIWEILDVIGRRGYKIYINRFSHAYIMLHNYIWKWDYAGWDWMCRDSKWRFLVPKKWNWFIFG